MRIADQAEDDDFEREAPEVFEGFRREMKPPGESAPSHEEDEESMEELHALLEYWSETIG